MSKAAILDASALLCLLNKEQRSEHILEALPTAVIGAANLAEVVSKLRERGLGVEEWKTCSQAAHPAAISAHPHPRTAKAGVTGLRSWPDVRSSVTGSAI